MVQYFVYDLQREVKGWTKGCPKQIVLESLYQDLKKLKE